MVSAWQMIWNVGLDYMRHLVSQCAWQSSRS